MDALQVMPDFFSLPSGQSSHSGHLEKRSQGLLPNHDEVRNGGQRPLTKNLAKTILLPDGQRHSLHDAKETPLSIPLDPDSTSKQFQLKSCWLKIVRENFQSHD